MYLFLAVVGLRCCEGFPPAVESGGCFLVVVHGLLIVVPLVAEHGLWGARASVVEARRLGSCGSRAEFRGMWVSFPPRSETEPMSPALEGGFFTPEPPGKAWPCGFHFRFSVNSRKEGMASHCSTQAWRLTTDRGAWWGTVRRVAKSRRQLGD